MDCAGCCCSCCLSPVFDDSSFYFNIFLSVLLFVVSNNRETLIRFYFAQLPANLLPCDGETGQCSRMLEMDEKLSSNET